MKGQVVAHMGNFYYDLCHNVIQCKKLLFFCLKAMKILHDTGTKTVVITSSELGDHKTLIALGSTVNGR